MRILGWWVAFASITWTANAQGVAILRDRIAGGGGVSTGLVYSVSGTIGQADAGGALESGPYRLAGGFQVPDGAGFPLEAPVLRVELLSGDALRISWPTRATGFVLHEAPSLGLPPSPSVWSPIPFPYQTNDTDISITTPLVADRYFRLQRP